MHSWLKKFGIIAVASLAVAVGSTGAAQARWHGGWGWGGFAPGFVGGLALGAAIGPHYYYDYDAPLVAYDYYAPPAVYYGPTCYVRRTVRYDWLGERIVRRVRVCD